MEERVVNQLSTSLFILYFRFKFEDYVSNLSRGKGYFFQCVSTQHEQKYFFPLNNVSSTMSWVNHFQLLLSVDILLLKGQTFLLFSFLLVSFFLYWSGFVALLNDCEGRSVRPPPTLPSSFFSFFFLFRRSQLASNIRFLNFKDQAMKHGTYQVTK